MTGLIGNAVTRTHAEIGIRSCPRNCKRGTSPTSHWMKIWEGGPGEDAQARKPADMCSNQAGRWVP